MDSMAGVALGSRSGRDVAAVAGDRAATTSGYIASPLFDSIFFIFAPTFACFLMGLYALLYLVFPAALGPHSIGSRVQSPAAFIAGSMTMAHLFAVFFRSHANPAIFRLYPARFTVVPVVLLTAVWCSMTAAVLVAILGALWDVYHSSLQTFGLGRIYDSKLKNDALKGRRLDYFLNLVLYVGPILSGASLAMHADIFMRASDQRLPGFVRALTLLTTTTKDNARLLQLCVIPIGVAYVIYYLLAYRRLIRDGYQVSHQKVALLSSTAVTSSLIWGLNPAGTAFIIMNFFHAFQYFGLVWIMERRNIRRLAGFGDAARWAPLVLFVVVLAPYGIWAWLLPTAVAGSENFSAARFAIAVSLTVSILHFWYDGFIWSVRKQQV